MKITIDNKISERFKLSLEQVRSLYRVAVTTLATENQKRQGYAIPKTMEISLTFVGDEEIAEINEKYRGVARPTDVLSFPMFEADEPLCSGSSLGDLIISADTMKRQAAEYGHSEKRELCFLFVHGLLHLLGYDHENGGLEAMRMREKEEAVLTQLGLPRTVSYTE